MEDAIAGIIAILLIAAPFVAVIVIAFRYQKRMFTRAWENVERAFREEGVEICSGLSDDKSVFLDISGKKNNRNIRVFSEYVGIGKSRHLFTRIVVNVDIPFTFELGKENVFTKAGEAIGIEDLKTGNSEFDNTFRLHSFQSQETLHLFTDKLISEFVKRKKDFTGKMELSNNILTLSMNATPGQSYGLRYFRAGLSLVLLFTESNCTSRAHSPNYAR